MKQLQKYSRKKKRKHAPYKYFFLKTFNFKVGESRVMKESGDADQRINIYNYIEGTDLKGSIPRIAQE